MVAVSVKGSSSSSGSGSTTGPFPSIVEVADELGSWEPALYVDCINCTAACAPNFGNAQFVYRWGAIHREDKSDYTTEPYLALSGKFVRVSVGSGNKLHPLFVGVIEAEQPFFYGSDSGGGKGVFYAQGLGQFLSRVHVETAKCVNGSGTEIEVDTVPVANLRFKRGPEQIGNRSNSKGSDGAYRFSSYEADVWTHRDLAEMLLIRYAPSTGVDWALGGQVEALEGLKSRVAIEGRTVWEILNELIHRSRGLSFFVEAYNGKATIHVFTIVEEEVTSGDFKLPKNPNLVNLDITNNIDTQNFQVTIATDNKYDKVKVVGEPLLVCGNFSYTDGTLEKKWTDALETEYEDAVEDNGDYKQKVEDEEYTDAYAMSDQFRQDDKFRDVFQKHGVPRSWNGQTKDGLGGSSNVFVIACDDEGELNTSGAASFYFDDKRFESFIPIRSGDENDTDNEPQYLEPLVWIKLDGYHWPAGWHGMVNRLVQNTERYRANVYVTASGLSVYVEPSINHYYGSGHFVADTNLNAALDYEDLIVTAAVRVDSRLKVVKSADGADSDNPRIKYIRLNDAQLWYIVPNTSYEWDADGEFKKWTKQSIVRDDRDRLRAAAALAAAWYLVERRAVSVVLKRVDHLVGLGSILKSVYTSSADVEANTPVTSIRYDFNSGTVQVMTQWNEMDFTSF